MKKSMNFIIVLIIMILFPICVTAGRVAAGNNNIEQEIKDEGGGGTGGTNNNKGNYLCEDNINPDYKIVYGNIKDCYIQFGDRQYGEIVDFCGTRACAQKVETDTSYNPTTSKRTVTCESGFSPVTRFGSYFLEENYRQYYSITFCMSKVYVANTNLDYENVCGNKVVMDIVRIIGYLISVFKWIVPFIIIVLGMLDFGKAILSDDENAPSKSLAALARRLLAGVIIFFVPTIILSIINLFNISDGVEKEEHASFGACTRCLFDPYRDECKTSE